MTGVYDIVATTIDGKQQSLGEYAGKAMLVVNVASRCGFTPQYAGLESLYRRFAEKGFVVLGFPCNQFGAQEPGADNEIAKFCSANYAVSFPMFAKIEVNGENTHPLYRLLKHAAPGIMGLESIKWNFTKFLIDREGQVVRRYAPNDTPEAIGKDIEALLG